MTVQPNTKEPRFITLEEALSLHESAIDAHGGSYGVRDQGLLESALAAPRQGFGGQYAYAFPHEMAAAYLFHLCKNHAFIDGNKRIAWVCAVFFMRLNGWNVVANEQEAIQVVLRVATDEMDKPAVAAWLMVQSRPKLALELRDFFRALTFDQVQAACHAVSQVSGEPFDADFERLLRAMPCLGREGHAEHGAVLPVNPNEIRASIQKAVLLTAIFRIAEDQGYEW